MTKNALNFPLVLREHKQWILWKRELKTDGKITKIPYQVNGRKAASTRPEEWSTFSECLENASAYNGLGYVFNGGVIGIDLDHCILPDGTLEPWAREIADRFPSYTERSPSGSGLHILIQSDVELPGRKLGDVECYSAGRFFTVTGDVFEGRNELRDCDILEWHKETFKEKEEKVKEGSKNACLPKDEMILSVMFRSKNGSKMQSLYQNGNWKDWGYTSQSQADMALVGALMFFCGNDKVTVDRLFRKSDLYREKWNEMRGTMTYGEWTMQNSQSAEVMAWKNIDGYLMSKGKDPVPLLILENICRAFDQDPELSGRFRLNDFSHMIEVRHGEVWVGLTDYDVLDTQRYISTHFEIFSKISKELTVDAIRCVANLTKVNPQREYFDGLVWDRVPRVDTWLATAFGTPDDELHRAMGSNWLKGLVKRVIEPGCIFDEVLVLEGAQGMRKSTALRELGKPWHTESTLSTDDKDFYMLLARNVIVEFAEGEIIGRTSAQKLKAVITKTEDTFRPPYEHGMMTFKRSCVFAMTTNNSDYQKDDTGGRRWLPVVLQKKANIDWLRDNRDQLFAEALYRVKVSGETTYEYPHDELSSMQDEKMEEDVYDEAVEAWYNNLLPRIREEGISLMDVYDHVIMKGRDDGRVMDKHMQWRLSSLVKRVLKLKRRTVRLDGKIFKRWVV